MAKVRRGRELEMNPNMPKGGSEGTVQFIQIRTPGKATSSSLSLIRSHVARRQRTRKPKTMTVVRSKDGNEAPASCTSAMTVAPRAAAQSLKARPRTSVTHIAWMKAHSPSPQQLIGSSRNDAPHVLAGKFAVEEQFLFDFYFTYVISYGYEACYREQDAMMYHKLMREVWIPYVLAEPCLLAAIFHVACRNYLVISKHNNGAHFEIKRLEYRAKCLDVASKAIESKNGASDTMIALALLMASESFFDGDIASFSTHGRAVVQMVRSRGGLHHLGIGGFLGRIVGSCIFNPSHNLVAGPIEMI